MKRHWKTLIIGLAVAGLMACGGEEEGAIDGPNCGENTVEEQGECVPEYPEECGEGEVRDEKRGDCVPAGETYCAEGTILDPELGLCVAETVVECGEDTIEEGDECIPAVEISCGEGTVAFDGECVVEEDVCGGGTERPEGEEVCRPTEDVCGEGTTFDVAQRVCIPESTLSCGSGTIVDDDFVCVNLSAFYEELAEDPDIDLRDEEADSEIEAGDAGDSVVFVGTIDAPKKVEGQFVQDEDHIQIEADEGQWLRVTVYSMGLPEPGFAVTSQEADYYYRLSDLGAGVETIRELAIPETGTYELAISNLPQLLDDRPPAGGQDWDYVGVVETIDTPEATEVDIADDVFAGDIRDLSENFYRVQGLDDVGSAALFFDELARDAEMEIQIWADEQSYTATENVVGGTIPLDTGAESLYLLFDRVHASGGDVDYEAHIKKGQLLEGGDTLSEEVVLEAGEYVGLFQDNFTDASVAATIYDEGGQTLASTASLEVSTADTGQNSLYWYAPSTTEITLEVSNTSSEDIEEMIMGIQVGTADPIDEFVELDYSQPLIRGQRHYFELNPTSEQFLGLEVESTGSVAVELYDGAQELLADGVDGLSAALDSGSYVLSVEAESTLSDGFTLLFVDPQTFDVSESNTPYGSIGEFGTSDTITIDDCPAVIDIDMDIDLVDDFPTELNVHLTDPGGEERMLKEGSSDFYSIIGNFNQTLDPLGNGEPIDVFVGTSGTGQWTVTIENISWIVGDWPGTLNSWGLNLTCAG